MDLPFISSAGYVHFRFRFFSPPLSRDVQADAAALCHRGAFTFFLKQTNVVR